MFARFSVALGVSCRGGKAFCRGVSVVHAAQGACRGARRLLSFLYCLIFGHEVATGLSLLLSRTCGRARLRLISGFIKSQ